MIIVKSFSVGEGDMFYIRHGSDNFTIIDCCLSDKNKGAIVDEILIESKNKGITRFISSHPDDDHICGLQYLDERISILNFYCVKNDATKQDSSKDFDRYCELRDSAKKAYYISKGCRRRWMNETNEERASSGIEILWPITSNKRFQEELIKAKEGDSPNNISPIIKYSLSNGVSIIWMGDLEEDFLEEIEEELDLPKIDLLFAPHHGRDKVPDTLLEMMKPKIIIIGEAPSKDLNYYSDYNTITQNTAGDITLECDTGKVHIYVSNKNYSVNFLADEDEISFDYYIGTLYV